VPEKLNYRWSWGLVLLISVMLQLAMPIVSDEAYFIAWGKTLSAGYYDHPPLPGWISFVLRQGETALGLQMHGLFHRLFALALGGGALWLVSRRLRVMDAAGQTTALVALALIPGSLVLFNLYLNDTLLVFLTLVFVLSTEAAYSAETRNWRAVVVAGVSFGAVLLTKYNGAVIYLGIVLALTTWPRGRRFLFGQMVVISLIALVPFGWHLWWNYNHCSINLVFNFLSRNSHAAGYGPLRLVLSMILMSGLAAFAALWGMWRATRLSKPLGFFSRSLAASLLLMLALSLLQQDFGANWGAPLGFMAVLALGEMSLEREMRWSVIAGYGLSAVILLPLGLLLMALHFDFVRSSVLVGPAKAYSADLHLDIDAGTLPDALRPFAKNRVLVTLEYGLGAGFDNAGFTETTVMSKSVFGRNQDLMTDFRMLDGRDMIVIPNGPTVAMGTFSRLFDSVEVLDVSTTRRQYHILIGHGFKYNIYRKNWILPVISMYYDQSAIPVGACYMDIYR